MALLYSGLDATAAGEVVAALEAEGVPSRSATARSSSTRAARDRLRMELAAQGPAGRRPGRLRDPRRPDRLRHHQPDVRRRLLARQGGRARPHHHRLAERPLGPRPPGEPGQPAVLALAGRLGLGHRHHGARRARPRPGRGDPLPRLLRRRRHRPRGGRGHRRRPRGVVLAGKEDPLAGGAGATDREATLRANIERLLEARVGPGRAIVEVNIDAAMESETVSERTIDPESRVAISLRGRGDRTRPPAAPTPASPSPRNLPDGDVGGEPGGNRRNATESRERQNFEVSETRREKVIAPGQVRRVSVAVMVDGVTATDADGAESWAPRRPSRDRDAAPAGAVGDRLRRRARRRRHHPVAAVHPAARAGRAGRAPARASSPPTAPA